MNNKLRVSYLILLALLIFPTDALFASKRRRLSVPELIRHSDVIVIGIAEKKGKHTFIQVNEILLGSPKKEIGIQTASRKYGISISIDPKHPKEMIFFLKRSRPGYSLVAKPQDLKQREEFTLLIKMAKDPKSFIRQHKYEENTHLIYLIGQSFGKENQNVSAQAKFENKLSVAEALTFLHKKLNSKANNVVLGAIRALRIIGSKKTTPHAIPLLNHEYKQIQIYSAQLLGTLGDKRALKPLHDALDKEKPRKYEDSSFASNCAWALVGIGDKSSVPSLKSAYSRGIYGGVPSALAYLGGEDCFELILQQAEARSVGFHTLEMMRLRTNLKRESWMSNIKWIGKDQTKWAIKWRKWWENHKKDFKYVRTYSDAQKRLSLY